MMENKAGKYARSNLIYHHREEYRNPQTALELKKSGKSPKRLSALI